MPTLKAREVLHEKITRLFFTAHLERFCVGPSEVSLAWNLVLSRFYSGGTLLEIVVSRELEGMT